MLVNDRVISREFYFRETPHARSFAKIKPLRKFPNLQYSSGTIQEVLSEGNPYHPSFLCILGNFPFFCRLLIFSKFTFSKISFRKPSECQIFWIQIRPGKMSCLTWIQTVCISYKQTLKVITFTCRQTVNSLHTSVIC